MSPRKRVVSDEMKSWMQHCARSTRDTADQMARQYGGVDDPMHPWMGVGPDQVFRDYVDFIARVARPLVEADGDEITVQVSMALYRKESPFGICVSLVMLQNRVDAAEAAQARVKALIDGWQGGTGHTDNNKFVSIADLKVALADGTP